MIGPASMFVTGMLIGGMELKKSINGQKNVFYFVHALNYNPAYCITYSKDKWSQRME